MVMTSSGDVIPLSNAMWCGSCLSVSLWMRNNVNQKGTNKLDLLVVLHWGGEKSKTN